MDYTPDHTTTMSRHVFLVVILIFSSIGLCRGGVCPDDWEEEHRGGLAIQCCHIPDSVTDSYEYCQGLNAEFGNDRGLKLCFLPVELRKRRSGLLFGSPPPPPTPPPSGK